jgi:hypothetical protein
MNLVAPCALLVLCSCTSISGAQGTPAGSPPEAEPAKQFAIYLGERNLGEDDWAPVEEQGMLGFEYSQDGSSKAIGWEIGLAGSGDDSGPFSGATGEIYGGLRASFGSSTVRPYIGGGLSFIGVEVDVLGADEDDNSLAGYVHGGVEFLVSPTFFIGLDLRVLFGSEIDIGGVEGDADYGQGALTFGWRF